MAGLINIATVMKVLPRKSSITTFTIIGENLTRPNLTVES